MSSRAALQTVTEQVSIALSTHVFYRALENVPQLVRNWYEACKDRQLAMSFISVVTRHLSPVLIEHEFAVIRQPGVLKALENDSLSVRVLSASAEITAKYIIDEQPMEIAIKLPQDYPLRNVEVKEVNRVGVTEGKWRGWMLNVQQLVMSRVSTAATTFRSWLHMLTIELGRSSQNGLLLEALKLFKTNVSLHFEGKTECSIVSWIGRILRFFVGLFTCMVPQICSVTRKRNPVGSCLGLIANRDRKLSASFP